MQQVEQWMRRIATGLVMPMPLLLLYALAPAEIVMTTVAVLFAAHCLLRREWGWLRQGWVVAAGLLWAQIVLAAVLAGHGVVQAAAFVRYFVFVAALQGWVLPDPRTRRVLGQVYGAVAVWLVVGCWQQYLCGRNFMGYGRWEDGALLGPLWAPRAGHALVMTALPGLFPLAIGLARREGARGRIMAGALLLGLVVTMVLIAQRMPLLRLLLAMGLCGLLVPRLRAVVGATIVLGVGAVALSPLLAPQAYHKLVLNFIAHMQGFADSPYGMLFIRAGVMIGRHPWLGLGFDGFRHACPDPAYFHGLPWLGVSEGVHGAAVGCNLHPHNFYLLMGTMGGVPAMVLFAAFAACVLARAWRGLTAATAPCEPQRLMLAVACVVVLWPLQSTSSLLTQPTAGWLFMAIGWALACVPSASHLQSVRGRD
ncbi:O-antigen ligase family protein [Komagataeibacter sp. AV436]|uniref:O-antigen ligase family protein n=1 Tax=Komagataeibacter melomenusus TaxID=2766578 RepID=A0ABX2AHK7_9PROT|nr:O-antigen ligase family protein [Komagataeibacter melomenusus]MBV1832050.1 O-antigen ligase family protein [Komagataeibacter melomenusus]NPC67856.1 O-antigen ligase family protein [Komagataeibacter melomenusus]